MDNMQFKNGTTVSTDYNVDDCVDRLRFEIRNGKFTNFFEVPFDTEDLEELIRFLRTRLPNKGVSVDMYSDQNSWIYNVRGDKLFGHWVPSELSSGRRCAFQIDGSVGVTYLDRAFWKTEEEMDARRLEYLKEVFHKSGDPDGL